jgi:hypothetical protein
MTFNTTIKIIIVFILFYISHESFDLYHSMKIKLNYNAYVPNLKSSFLKHNNSPTSKNVSKHSSLSIIHVQLNKKNANDAIPCNVTCIWSKLQGGLVHKLYIMETSLVYAYYRLSASYPLWGPRPSKKTCLESHLFFSLCLYPKR